jgi:peptidoglycan/LPS O-acetylase OafA/YrhL
LIGRERTHILAAVTSTALAEGQQSEAARPGPGRSGDFHIPSLDGIRALSFLVVFEAHVGIVRNVPGGFGVTVFFFLSGYLITTLLRLEHQETGRISLRDFYLRRVLRILPPFYAVLILAILVSLLGLHPTKMEPLPVIAQLAHFTNYWLVYHGTDGTPPGTIPYWSLAVEEHFYLLFPAVFILLQRRLAGRWKAQGLILWGLCAAVLIWRLVLVLVLHAPQERTYLASDTRIDSILFGCALALAANPMLDRIPGSPALWRRVLLPAGLALLVWAFVKRDDWFRESLRYTVQGIGLTPLFVVAMRQPTWGPMRFLNWAPVRRIGVLSYSLYLVHQVVLYMIDHWRHDWSPTPRFIVGLAVSLAIAQAINRFIEKPCARLRRRLAHAHWLAGPGAGQSVR